MTHISLAHRAALMIANARRAFLTVTSAAVIASLALVGVSHAGPLEELAVLNFGAGPASIAGLCLNCNIAVFPAGVGKNLIPTVNITGSSIGGGLSTLSGATTISASPITGALYVSSGILNGVEAYAPDTTGASGPVLLIVASKTVPLSLPEGISVIGAGGGALEGSFYVANFTGGTAPADAGSVILFPADAGTPTNPVGTPTGVINNLLICTALNLPNTELLLPVGVVTDAEGNAYVANAGNAALKAPSYVTEYAAGQTGGATGCVAPINLVGLGTLVSANGVAVDTTGNIWVSDLGANAIFEFSPAGALLTEISGSLTQLDSPMGIALSPTGLAKGVDDLYVANSRRGSVLVFEDVSDGGLLNVKPLQALKGPKTKLTIPIGVAPL